MQAKDETAEKNRDITGQEVDWRKSISIGRNRLQSRGLATIASVILLTLCVRTAQIGISGAGARGRLTLALAISCVFAAGAWMLRAATPAGAACGGMICLLLTLWTRSPASSALLSALTPLILLFILTFTATRAGRHRKARAGLAEGRCGRNAAQIIANLGVAGLCAGLPALLSSSSAPASRPLLLALHTACLAALVEATADTVSSEIGQAFGGQPRMLLSFRQVPVGTDGAITALGTLTGVLAGVLVAAAGVAAMSIGIAPCSIALVAGVCGLFFDSLLGATVERRGWLGNDFVNLSSTVFSAALAFACSAALS